MGDQNVYPGPVDNSGLLRGKTRDVVEIYGHYYVALTPHKPRTVNYSGSSYKKWEQKQHCCLS